MNFGEIDLDSISFIDNITYVLRIDKRNLFDNYNIIANLLTKVSRFNIIITDIESFTEKDFLEYEDVLLKIVDIIVPYFEHCRTLNVNILTDRIHLNQMNNCNAGYETITLAPNGNFYVCPAFYYANNVKDPKSQEDVCKSGYNIGNINDGLKIRNSHLYKLSHAPLCRICDAYHCKRCVWLNRLQTLEINTPSHEQCVVSHIERNVSKYLLTELKQTTILMECKGF